MKKLVAVQEIPDGLETLLGEKVMLLCMNYIYSGVLEGVNTTCVLLGNPEIVYETGPWTTKKWQDAQSLHCPKLYVQTAAIEAFGLAK